MAQHKAWSRHCQIWPWLGGAHTESDAEATNPFQRLAHALIPLRGASGSVAAKLGF